jgi:hypothetical protein
VEITDREIDRFFALFPSNLRSFGQFNPSARVKAMTVRAEASTEHVRSHLEGHTGLGLVPIRDDGTCLWAAIDIDVHGPNGRPVDIFAIEQKVAVASLPLVICRSKSGGVHAYIFLKMPTQAVRVRAMLTRWSGVLGYAGAEIFPKQINLDRKPTDSEQPLGNWINLPYFGADDTERYAVDGGKQVSLDYFMELAEAKRTDLAEQEQGTDADYAPGPPCLQKMIAEKVDEGSRNTAVFQAGVFLKRAYPEDWRQRLDTFNQIGLANPLSPRELRVIGSSVAKKDYQYKCREEPCRTFCDKEMCKSRPYGITATDAAATEIPIVDAVEKIVATPVRWALTIKGQLIEVTTAQLFNYDLFRQAVAEKLHLVMPSLKRQEWDVYLREILQNVTERKETTQEDIVFVHLCEYLRRVRVDKNLPEEERRDNLRRGTPTLISIGKVSFNGKAIEEQRKEAVWYYAFKMSDFIAYLRRKKALGFPEHAMATYLYRVLGDDAKRDKIRVGDARISNIWCVPEEDVLNETVPVKEFKAEY